MTGKYPFNNGLQALVIPPHSQTCLPTEHKTIFEYMKDEGYGTKYVGKWHLGDCNVTCLPNGRGIDDFRGILAGGAGYFDWAFRGNGVMQRVRNGVPDTENLGRHLTLQDKKDVKEMILEHKGKRKPLFMWITPTAPHDPPQTTEKMYNVHDFLDESDPKAKRRRQYLGLVSALDDIIGVTMKSLKTAGLDKNTIIVFSSDNGGYAIQSGGVDASSGNNYPLRNSKGGFTEGGVKSPAIYYDPRLTRRNRGATRDFLVHITDWLPTLVHLGTKGKKSKKFRIPGIDGRSQLANLGSRYNNPERRKYRIRKEMLVALTSYDPADYNCSTNDAAYRWRDYKLIYGKTYGLFVPAANSTDWPKPPESPELPAITGDSCYRMVNGERVARCLFNVADDESEQKDLYDEKPKLVAFLVNKIMKAKERSVRPAYTNTLGLSNVTAQALGDILVPRYDYCDPAIHSPLVPNSPTCY